VILTDAQKQQADALGLTYIELTVALKTHIPLETYARHKRELQAERAAWDAKMAEFAGAVSDGLEGAYKGGRGVALPPLEEESG